MLKAETRKCLAFIITQLSNHMLINFVKLTNQPLVAALAKLSGLAGLVYKVKAVMKQSESVTLVFGGVSLLPQPRSQNKTIKERKREQDRADFTLTGAGEP